MGRTARGLDNQGNALLFLNPEERNFLKYLRNAKIPLVEYEFAWNKILNVQSQVNKNIFIYLFNGIFFGN